MASAIFEFFELMVDEFQGKKEVFFGVGRMQDRHGTPNTLLVELKRELKVSKDSDVIPTAVKEIIAHFEEKSGTEPFNYEPSTSRFYSPNEDFMDFVRTCKEIRSLGTRAKDFELAILERLSHKLSGEIHRVGWPHERLKRSVEFNKHLRANFGFKLDVALGSEKDGGFDILWKIPLGGAPFVPIVSIQCKNGDYSFVQAASSLVASRTSLVRHVYLHKEVHVNCVVFNDYISPKELFPKGSEYVPIGLSDLVKRDPLPSVVVRI